MAEPENIAIASSDASGAAGAMRTLAGDAASWAGPQPAPVIDPTTVIVASAMMRNIEPGLLNRHRLFGVFIFQCSPVIGWLQGLRVAAIAYDAVTRRESAATFDIRKKTTFR